MQFSELQRRFQAIKPLIHEAGQMVKKIRKSGSFHVHTKEDGSPVTNADIEANSFLRNGLENLFPGEAMIGEEDSDKAYEAGSPLVWYIDPIDGTRTFVQGGSHYYILIGLVADGEPILGLHYRPETGELLYGWKGSYPKIENLNDHSVSGTQTRLTWPDTPRIFLKTNNGALRNVLADLNVERAGYAPGMVDMVAPLFGIADGFVTFRRTAYWDLAAPAAIMASAGFIGPQHHKNGSLPFSFNDGNHKTDLYYSLPPDSPADFIAHIHELRKRFRD